jgi:hypothetical protein
MLFGHQNDDMNRPAGPTPVVGGADAAQDTGLNPLAVDPATGASLPVAPTQPDEPATSVLDQPSPESTSDATDTGSSLTSDPDPLAAAPGQPADDAGAAPAADDTPAESADSNPHAAAGTDDLLTLKQQALTQLSPLVSQLDQTPEEKFRTTMMMIQSTDNQALIKEAYDAAQQIPDEKARAQALLDVVNEINYFTQAKQS